MDDGLTSIQYKAQHCVRNREGTLRVPDAPEREAMPGFPVGYTNPCLPKQFRKGTDHNDTRLTLLGNSWSVPVVAWLIGQLFERLGLISSIAPQQVLEALAPGGMVSVQARLVRAPLNPSMANTEDCSARLAMKLSNLISIKAKTSYLPVQRPQQ